VHDAADDAAIVHPLDAPDIRWQARFDPLPLLIAQPKQIPAHDPDPLPKTNQDRIVRAEKLMSSDPNTVNTVAIRKAALERQVMAQFCRLRCGSDGAGRMSVPGTERTYRDSSRMSALRGEADLA
jgi:hypothetical protein